MNLLDLTHINIYAPYSIWREGDQYRFKTDYDILYSISFDKEIAFGSVSAYWFNLANVSNKKSPNDKKIPQTIICLIEGFFKANPDILLYICDNANEQQAERDRLFLRWFNKYEQKKLYIIKSAVVEDEGVDNYVSMILQQSNPLKDTIVEIFDSQIRMFKEQK